MNIESITCPNCQQKNTVTLRSSKSFVCTNCGSQVAVKNGELITKKNKRRKASKTDLKLGLKGTLRGDTVEVVGWLLYRMKEEGRYYYWEEWLLAGTKNLHWITYDHYSKKYHFFTRTTQPLNKPHWNARRGSQFTVDGTTYRVLEKATGELYKIKGEIPWKAAVGEKIEYFDARRGSQRLSVEWTQNELEVFTGNEISRKEILQGFNLKKALEKLIHREKTHVHWYKIDEWVLGLFMLGVAFTVLAFIFGKNVVYSETVQLCSNLEEATNPVVSNCSSTTLGPIPLENNNRVFQVRIKATSVAEQNWPYLLVELLDENRQPQRGFAGDFWRERWQEGGESGVESNTSKVVNYRLTDPGNYYLYLELDKTQGYDYISQDTFEITVYDHVLLSRYFMLYSGVVFVIIFINNKWYEHFDD